jgi:hypothetical protein
VETPVTVPEEHPLTKGALNGMTIPPGKVEPPRWMWAAVGGLMLKTQRLNKTVPADESNVKNPFPSPSRSATAGASLAPVMTARKLAVCAVAVAARNTNERKTRLRLIHLLLCASRGHGARAVASRKKAKVFVLRRGITVLRNG